jgi:hypothetical protein
MSGLLVWPSFFSVLSLEALWSLAPEARVSIGNRATVHSASYLSLDCLSSREKLAGPRVNFDPFTFFKILRDLDYEACFNGGGFGSTGRGISFDARVALGDL